MDTLVVAFETSSLLSLKALSETAQAFLFPLRVFPVLVQHGKIIKRWALVKTEKDTFSFLEREESCATLQEFIGQQKKEVCAILVDMPDSIGTKCYFRLSTAENTLAVCTEHGTLSVVEVDSIQSGIIQGLKIFFEKAVISLIGIRIKNKSGKKETVDICVGVEKVKYMLPSEMSMTQEQPQGVEVFHSPVTMANKLLLKVLSGNVLFFAESTESLFLRIELVEEQPFAVLLRRPGAVTILDSVLPYVKKHYLREYLQFVLKKYGEDLKVFADLLCENSRKSDIGSLLAAETQKIRGMSGEKKSRALLGICDMLSTLQFSKKSSQGQVVSHMKKMYMDAISKQKIEGAVAPMCVYILPTKAASASSLHSFFKELEM